MPVKADDLERVHTIARLLSFKATMTHGDAWSALLAEHDLTDATFMALYGQLSARFATEPALAAAYAKRFQDESAARFREAAEAKGVDADPSLAGPQWNAVHDIAEKAEGFARQYAQPAGDGPPPGYAPDLELIARTLAEPTREHIEALFDDRTTVIHVDWREEPLDILELIAQRLPEGVLFLSKLSSEGVTVASDERTAAVELTETPADRDAMLHACNEVLQPAFEVRLCVDSKGSDTLAFVCLRAQDWRDLEADGAAMRARFAPLAGQPLFT